MKTTTIKLKNIFSLIILISGSYIYSQDTIAITSFPKNQLLEFSFGQSMLFISNSKLINIRNQEAIVVPTSSMLFFVELRPQKRFRIPIFFNVPTESKQFLVNGQLVNERASPTFGVGVQLKCFQIKLDDKSKIDKTKFVLHL